ncbi:MAG: VanW family protein [Rubrobacter sp.]|nr:VanW family protein [Rubrobacter sp.]
MRIVKRSRGSGEESGLKGFLEKEPRKPEPQKPGPRSSGRRRLVGPVLVLCAVLAVLVAADYAVNAGKVYRGVETGSVSLGGMTPDQARAAVEERSEGALQEVRFTGSEEVAFPAEEVGVDFDVEATVDRAYAVGREGGFTKRLTERFESAFGTVRIPPEVGYRPELARAEVEELAGQMDEAPEEGSVRIVGSEVAVGSASDGYRLDVPATVESVDRAVQDLTGEAELVGETLAPEVSTEEAESAGDRARRAMSAPLIFEAGGEQWTISPAQMGRALAVEERDGTLSVGLDRERLSEDLADIPATLQRPAIEAEFMVDGDEVDVTRSQIGRTVQMQELLGAVEAGVFEGQRRFEVPVVQDRPELTTQVAERLKPEELIGEFRTNYLTYDDEPGRVTNLEIASDVVDGTLLAPGEVFSFNELAAPLEYEEASVIIDGQVDTAIGGGLCQVSSSLYMAANYAGLESVERHPHFAELPYIRPGFDATVWFGALDMQFRNNTPGYLLLREEVTDDGFVEARIYGQPTGREVEMDSEKTRTTRDGEGNEVTQWETTQTVSQNGQVVSDGVIHTDTYGELQPADTSDGRPLD